MPAWVMGPSIILGLLLLNTLAAKAPWPDLVKRIGAGNNAEWFAAIIAFFAFLFSFRTWYKLRAQSRQEMRAYVHVEHPVLSQLDDGNIRFAFYYTNFGQTPAKKVSVSCKVSWASEISNEDIDALDMNRRADIGPSQRVPWKIEERDGVHHGTPKMSQYLYGKIVYETVFGDECYTKFCFKRDDRELLVNAVEFGNEST